MKASDNRTPDVGRTVGNGVVLAYAAAAVTITAMVIAGPAPWYYAAGIVWVTFLFVLADDHVIQLKDMDRDGLRADGSGHTNED